MSKMRVLIISLFLVACSTPASSSKVIFSSSAASPVTVEQKGNSLLVHYVNHKNTAGVIINTKEEIQIDTDSIQKKKGAGSTLIQMFEVVVNAVVEAVF